VGWTGKLLGGLIGGMLGGPVGAAAGAAMGHVVADDAPARGVRLVRLQWTHHVFTCSGPALRLAPVWRAVDHTGDDVEVRLTLGAHRHRATVVPETRDEAIALPVWTLPYAQVRDASDLLEVHVTLDAGGGFRDAAAFDVPMPNAVRQLGLSGPARLVMALVACARSGGRTLTGADRAFVREGFVAGWPLDAAGEAWLGAWMDELERASLPRLTPERVADRVAPHLGGDAAELLLWLMRGVRTSWPGPAAEAWVDAFATALGVRSADLDALWEATDTDAEHAERVRALATLGLPPGATLAQAQAAWRTLVREHHPDRAATPEDAERATRRTASVNAAWALLSGD
jgi:hypothetical protein